MISATKYFVLKDKLEFIVVDVADSPTLYCAGKVTDVLLFKLVESEDASVDPQDTLEEEEHEPDDDLVDAKFGINIVNGWDTVPTTGPRNSLKILAMVR